MDFVRERRCLFLLPLGCAGRSKARLREPEVLVGSSYGDMPGSDVWKALPIHLYAPRPSAPRTTNHVVAGNSLDTDAQQPPSHVSSNILGVR